MGNPHSILFSRMNMAYTGADSRLSSVEILYTWTLELIHELKSILHNYERPVKRGFFCSDTSIRYPYVHHDTVTTPILIGVLAVPFLILVKLTSMYYPILPRPHLTNLVGGTLVTVLVTACIKLGTGRLAPNFFEGCELHTYCGWHPDLTYNEEFTCSHPERLRELSRSFPCIYTSVTSFAWNYVLIFWLNNAPNLWTSPSFLRAVGIIIFLAPPPLVAMTRLHDNRSHDSDVIAGWLLGAFIAAVSAIGRNQAHRGKDVSSTSNKRLEKNEDSDVFTEPGPKEESKPVVQVCTSALFSNINVFFEELESRFHEFIERVVYVNLPYNDLDNYKPERFAKNDVIILCHSIDNRRLSLTDVTDALYDKFIPKVSKLCGKASFIVIAHDFEWTRDSERMDRERTLRAQQPTVYQNAGNIILAGKLGSQKTYNGLLEKDWDVIGDVISQSSRK